jgi:hypothetical protein
MLMLSYRLITQAYICFGMLHRAALFADQMRYICNLTRRFVDKVWALNVLSRIAKRLSLIREALIFAKKVQLPNEKGLQYAWFLNDKEAEIQSYELLGMLHYLNYQVEEGQLLHDRAVNGNCEPEDSLLKSISQKDLDKYTGALP